MKNLWIQFNGIDKPESETGFILCARVKFVGAKRAMEFTDTFHIKSIKETGYSLVGRQYTHWMPIEMPNLKSIDKEETVESLKNQLKIARQVRHNRDKLFIDALRKRDSEIAKLKEKFSN